MSKVIDLQSPPTAKKVTVELTEKEAFWLAVRLDEETMLYRYRVNMLEGRNPAAPILEHWKDDFQTAERILDKIAQAGS
jgi:hypothetical protein